MAAPLPAHPRLITFDTYGTLIDWDSALRAHLRRLLRRLDSAEPVEAVYLRWYDGHALPTAVSGPFVIYRELLRDTMAATLAEIGVVETPDELAALGDVMAEAPPFPEARAVLGRLHRHVPLATISNSQADIMARSVELLGDPFTHVITAEVVGAYKPAPALFELVLERAGVAPHEVVHVAQSQYVDLPRSVPMGIPTVWINRNAQTLRAGTPQPTAVLPDLHGLPALLGIGVPA